ncbi:PIN domain-containing protein [Candidatus Micrarchaeota archaeon]|nr:PIN domain-containing protein [Candidatus Micrarchaeota archaeon]MBU1166661.1 PIN domain-containing protein [Candidatus Micrarchaeota archaeon]MBU1886618.1 PIN domain-containing protein [Candidatus Micrarchaeota archaeon]
MILDTSVFIAFFHDTDVHHTKAVEIFKIAEERKIIISDYLFNEIITVLLRKIGLKKVKQIIDFLLNDEALIIRHTSRDEFFEVIDIFKKQNDHLSFVDCSIIWLSKQHNLEVATFDKSLKQEILKI